jgi:hypothetical protein
MITRLRVIVKNKECTIYLGWCFAEWTREYPEQVAFGSMNMGLYSGIKWFLLPAAALEMCSTRDVTFEIV